MSKHGWYSYKHEETNRKLKKDYDYHIYLNSKGEEVICTSVSSKKERPAWDDVVYKGEVSKWVRNEKWSSKKNI